MQYKTWSQNYDVVIGGRSLRLPLVETAATMRVCHLRAYSCTHTVQTQPLKHHVKGMSWSRDIAALS